jgi:hypothetical protein
LKETSGSNGKVTAARRRGIATHSQRGRQGGRVRYKRCLGGAAAYWCRGASASAAKAGSALSGRGTLSDSYNARTSGVYLRADPEDMNILNGRDERQRAKLIAERLRHWKSIKNA